MSHRIACHLASPRLLAPLACHLASPRLLAPGLTSAAAQDPVDSTGRLARAEHGVLELADLGAGAAVVRVLIALAVHRV